jgi:conjugal transfer pilus assembly protein TraA
MEFQMKKIILAVALLAPVAAMAASGSDTEFAGLYNMLTKWSVESYLTKALALAAFLFGAGVGVAKQTIVPAIAGVVFALLFSIAPGVITGMLGATV